MEPGQFTLISMGLIRYSCGHIIGPLWTDFGQIWAEDVFHYAPIMPTTHGIQNAEMQRKVFCDVIASVLYINLLTWYITHFENWFGVAIITCTTKWVPSVSAGSVDAGIAGTDTCWYETRLKYTSVRSGSCPGSCILLE